MDDDHFTKIDPFSIKKSEKDAFSSFVLLYHESLTFLGVSFLIIRYSYLMHVFPYSLFCRLPLSSYNNNVLILTTDILLLNGTAA